MTPMPKPRIVVSQCLEFAACRYNGQMIPAQFIRKFQRYVDFVPVCPEVEIGLGVPRDPIKLVETGGELHLVQPSTGRDLTTAMRRWSEGFLKGLGEVDGFILKFGSPSCGLANVKVHPAIDSPMTKRRDAGLFAAEVLRRFSGLAVEDEGRLTNFRIREHFLTKVFLFAAFRQVKARRRAADLVDFQARNKLLLMAYSQKHMKAMGQIIAGAKAAGIDAALADYEGHLREAFARNAKYTSHINVLMHALGYFKEDLDAREKKYFLQVLDRYSGEALPLSAALSLMQGWIIKYDKAYLHQQTYFTPYPEALVEITDSGKGRDGK